MTYQRLVWQSSGIISAPLQTLQALTSPSSNERHGEPLFDEMEWFILKDNRFNSQVNPNISLVSFSSSDSENLRLAGLERMTIRNAFRSSAQLVSRHVLDVNEFFNTAHCDS